MRQQKSLVVLSAAIAAAIAIVAGPSRQATDGLASASGEKKSGPGAFYKFKVSEPACPPPVGIGIVPPPPVPPPTHTLEPSVKLSQAPMGDDGLPKQILGPGSGSDCCGLFAGEYPPQSWETNFNQVCPPAFNINSFQLWLKATGQVLVQGVAQPITGDFASAWLGTGYRIRDVCVKVEPIDSVTTIKIKYRLQYYNETTNGTDWTEEMLAELTKQ